MSDYTLRRAGQFTVQTTGPNHCGTTERLTIKYRLAAVCPASGLDHRGFLFDQVAIDRWFQAQQATALSCERYAAYCARELFKLIRRENNGLTPKDLELTLSPDPFAAEITFHWNGATETVRSHSAALRGQQDTLGLPWGSLFA